MLRSKKKKKVLTMLNYIQSKNLPKNVRCTASETAEATDILRTSICMTLIMSVQ
jgi:uncharacterized protein (UPF0147 family)